MENKRKALGKGLEQLFSNEVINFDNYAKEIVENAKSIDIKEIDLNEIRSNPYQPRKSFNEETLKEFAESIKEHGILEPIIVKKSIKGYELVAGERRCKAAKMAGLEKIPAIIKEFSDHEMMEVALLENIQREDLNPIEEASAYQSIINLENLTQEEFAKKFGKSRSYVTNLLGLLNLPETVKNYVINKEITMGHARCLSKLDDDEKIIELAREVINKNLSVRTLENLINEQDLPKKQKQERIKPQKSIKSTIYEKLLREKVGTKVKITNKKIEIPYISEEELEQILELLGIRIEGL